MWDYWTWRAGSADDVSSAPHYLNVYAVGMRLDGVNSDVMKSMIANSGAGPSSNAAQPSYSALAGAGMFSGGAVATVTSGSRMFLTKSINNGTTKWDVAGRGSVSGAKGTLMDYFTNWTFAGTIVEGFGALDIKLKSGSVVTVNSGTATATVTVDSGYLPANYGGVATTTSGQGRMLYRMAMDPQDITKAIVTSRDHSGYASKGSTTAYLSEIAHVANSHGLCNRGPALAASRDGCVATICAANADPYCCTNYWDDACVAEVPSYCPSRSCANYTCSFPSYNGSYWNDNPAFHADNNCYNYATNTETGVKSAGQCAQPGVGSGRACDWIHDEAGGIQKLVECVKRDGLVAVPSASCPNPYMDLLVLVTRPWNSYYWTYGDYHWLRQDHDPVTGQPTTWSQKVACGGDATNMDERVTPAELITDPIATATRAGYANFVGYFCACSSSTEGQGHSVVF